MIQWRHTYDCSSSPIAFTVNEHEALLPLLSLYTYLMVSTLVTEKKLPETRPLVGEDVTVGEGRDESTLSDTVGAFQVMLAPGCPVALTCSTLEQPEILGA